MWKWAAPAAREAAYVLWRQARHSHHMEGRYPGTFHLLLIMTMEAADEPTLAQMATIWPGLASAVVAGKAGQHDALRFLAGEFATYVDERPGTHRPGISVDPTGRAIGDHPGRGTAAPTGGDVNG